MSFEDRIRRAERVVGANAGDAANVKVPPCPKCGRLAGQIAVLDDRRDLAKRPWRGGSGCEACVEGLPGEVRDPAQVTVIRIVEAPAREELRGGQ